MMRDTEFLESLEWRAAAAAELFDRTRTDAAAAAWAAAIRAVCTERTMQAARGARRAAAVA